MHELGFDDLLSDFRASIPGGGPTFAAAKPDLGVRR